MIEYLHTYRGIVYRAHNPRWAYAPDSGEGAARHGGRFNPIGTPALYTSERFETAWLEAQQGFPYKTQPLTLCAYEVHCHHLLDLTRQDVLNALAIQPDDLACPWEWLALQNQPPPTWHLAQRLIDAQVAGVRVPSFAINAGPRDINLVFWRWAATPPHQVRVIDDERRLPADQSSWPT